MCKGASKINQHLNVRDKRQGSATQKTTSSSSPLTTDQSTNTAVDRRAIPSMHPSHPPLSSTHTSCAPTSAPALPLFAMCVSVEYGKYIKVDRANSDSLPTALLYSAVLPALIHIQLPPCTCLRPRPCAVLCPVLPIIVLDFHVRPKRCKGKNGKKRNAFWPRKVKRLNFNKPLILNLIVAANGRLRGSAMIRMGCTGQKRQGEIEGEGRGCALCLSALTM